MSIESILRLATAAGIVELQYRFFHQIRPTESRLMDLSYGLLAFTTGFVCLIAAEKFNEWLNRQLELLDGALMEQIIRQGIEVGFSSLAA